MLLRSSSTPISGSFLSSSSSSPFFSESPTNNGGHQRYRSSERTSSSTSSFPYDVAHHPYPHLCYRFHPRSGPSDRDPSSLGFRRARSDGNLKYLLSDDSHHHQPPIKSSPSGHRTNPVLETIPSFSMYNSKEEEEEPQQQDEKEEEGGGRLTRSVTIGDIITAEFGFSGENKNLGLDENSPGNGKVGGNAVPPLYLARGLGIDRLASGIMNAGGGGGGGGKFTVRTGNGGEQFEMETYYKTMVDQNPADALFLRNYAQFLYQTKGDPRRAEEYYSRAILADPSDGEILSQYAKLVWEQHHDEERASCYFEQAVQASPHDSRVLAAYAGFLWEREDSGGVETGEGGRSQSINHGALASATT